MPAMLSRLYHALRALGADDATATAAAEEAAVGDARFAELRLDIEKRFGEMEKRFAEVQVDVVALRGDMRMLVWQTRLTLGGVIALVLYAIKQGLGF